MGWLLGLLVFLVVAFAVVLLAAGCTQQSQHPDESGIRPADRNASGDYQKPPRTWSG